jgi:hypothetical protein
MPSSIELKVVKPQRSPFTGLGLFSVVRNESYFLPFFFSHYRSLGVEHFLIYDDRSDDETRDFLHAQADCTIVTSEHRFGDEFGAGRRLPLALKESVPETAFPGKWALTVDADEFVVLPSEFRDLVELTRHLDQRSALFATAPMVDFYGATLADRAYPRSLSPFEGAPYFDAGPYYAWTGETHPQRFVAGVRFRLMAALRHRFPQAFASIYNGDPTPAALWKTPLLKHGLGVTRLGDHGVRAIPTGDVEIALAHFKFYPDLDAKIRSALSEGQYYNASMEYRFLEAATRLMGDDSLIAGMTRRFTGPQSLEDAGLIRVR